MVTSVAKEIDQSGNPVGGKPGGIDPGKGLDAFGSLFNLLSGSVMGANIIGVFKQFVAEVASKMDNFGGLFDAEAVKNLNESVKGANAVLQGNQVDSNTPEATNTAPKTEVDNNSPATPGS